MDAKMRAIKFRGKSKIDGEWFYGNLYDKDNRGRTHICTTSRGCLDIDPETVGQFTGLFDKNGKEIYEGDIVKLTQLHYEVTGKIAYINTEFALYVPEEDTTYDFFPSDRTSEVIGNIHDNPELLKGDM